MRSLRSANRVVNGTSNYRSRLMQEGINNSLSFCFQCIYPGFKRCHELDSFTLSLLPSIENDFSKQIQNSGLGWSCSINFKTLARQFGHKNCSGNGSTDAFTSAFIPTSSQRSATSAAPNEMSVAGNPGEFDDEHYALAFCLTKSTGPI